MTDEEAFQRAVNVSSGLAWCGNCEAEIRVKDFESARPGKDYNDLEFGQFIKSQGWTLHYREKPEWNF